MKWVVRIAVTLFFGFVFFGAIQYFFPFNIWLSVALAIVGALFVSLQETFDFVKKGYDALKAPYELRKLKREDEAAEREKNRVIQTPTPTEVEKYGSAIERTLDERYRKTGQFTLQPTPFIKSTREERFKEKGAR